MTKGGLELDCDFVVVGIGVMPDVTLAKAAGLELGEQGGVKCSAELETSEANIYAAGDICEYDSPIHGKPMRIEHWDVAFNQGKTAAFNMLGRGLEHDVVPYFFSDLADWVSMEYVGPGSGDVVIRGSLEEGEFAAFWIDDGRVTAAMSVGRSDDLEHARRFLVGAHAGRLGCARGPRYRPGVALEQPAHLLVRPLEGRAVLDAQSGADHHGEDEEDREEDGRGSSLRQMILVACR